MAPKVRFAPSPTGRLHVGNIRAALTNWLFARQQDGTFILRLDDTDRERSTKEFADLIQEDLAWLGLAPDEMYRQSDRFDQYEAATEKLKDMDRLYPCYESAEELDMKRKMQLARHKPPVYDRAALNLSDDDRAKLGAEGRKPHWRFKLDVPGRVVFNDLIRGEVSTDMASVSDPILIREDGSYLYTLPSVVDDIDMGITHIVRGEDHVTNSAVQVQIFEALGGKAPEMAHFPLMTTADGGGLSKRDGSLSIQSLREEAGLEPMAILSLLARLGTSDSVEPESTPEPLIKSFSFDKFARNAVKFDMRELEALNAKILHETPLTDVKARIDIEGLDEAFWLAVRPNIAKLSDVHDWWAIVNGPVTPKIEDKAFIETALQLLPAGDVTEETWKTWTDAIKEETGAKGRALFMPLRQALTGQDHGPELANLLPLIGRERIESRLSGKGS